HLRWTTDLRICGDGPDCIDFFSIALHELGHYIGLAHQLYNHHLVMGNAPVWPMAGTMTACDADNARRLYNPARLGFPVDNSYDCNAVTGVVMPAQTAGQLTVVSDEEEYLAVYTLRTG